MRLKTENNFDYSRYVYQGWKLDDLERIHTLSDRLIDYSKVEHYNYRVRFVNNKNEYAIWTDSDIPIQSDPWRIDAAEYFLESLKGRIEKGML